MKRSKHLQLVILLTVMTTLIMNAQHEKPNQKGWKLFDVRKNTKTVGQALIAENRTLGEIIVSQNEIVFTNETKHEQSRIIFTINSKLAKSTWIIHRCNFVLNYQGVLIGGNFDATGNLHWHRGIFVDASKIEATGYSTSMIAQHVSTLEVLEPFHVDTVLRSKIGSDFFVNFRGSAHPGMTRILDISVDGDSLKLKLANESDQMRAVVVMNLKDKSVVAVSREDRAP
jgi:hypothetical protein